MFFNGNATQPNGHKGNIAAAGVLKAAGPASARGYKMHALLMAGFLALTAVGGCVGNDAELASKMTASYHTSFQ
jgi:hypothetical protein